MLVARAIYDYGIGEFQSKIEDFIAFGAIPLSVFDFHIKFLYQIRDAFVVGSYYPALTGAAALGERILNHLILRLRDDYKGTDEYKDVYDKESFDNWNLAIDTLEAWGVLLPEVVKEYRRLAKIRNRKAIHFNPKTDEKDREYALEAIETLTKIIRIQFSGFGNQPWFIPGIKGASFIKKEWEAEPFIRHVYIKGENCVLVGPYHQVTEVKPDEKSGAIILEMEDDYDYEQREITDEEFAELYNNRSKKNL